MNIPSQTIIDVLTFLLPGFVSAAILHNLTPTPRPIPFERIVQALIFTFVIQVGTSGVATGLIGIGPWFGSIGVWSEQTRIAWSLALAVLLGGWLAWLQNTDSTSLAVTQAGDHAPNFVFIGMVWGTVAIEGVSSSALNRRAQAVWVGDGMA